MKREEFLKEFGKICEYRAGEIQSVSERDFKRFKYFRRRADDAMTALSKRLGVKYYDEDMDIANKKFLRRAKEEFGDNIEDEITVIFLEKSAEGLRLLQDDNVRVLNADYMIKYYKGL